MISELRRRDVAVLGALLSHKKFPRSIVWSSRCSEDQRFQFHLDSAGKCSNCLTQVFQSGSYLQ